MNTFINQQEIMFFTNTSFSQRQLFEKESKSNNRESFNEAEHLEEACWNGMLDELLPGVIQKASSGMDLYIWRIYHMNTCILIDLTEIPEVMDGYYSIDPHYYMPTVFWN
jgi:hypothetical protein